MRRDTSFDGLEGPLQVFSDDPVRTHVHTHTRRLLLHWSPPCNRQFTLKLMRILSQSVCSYKLAKRLHQHEFVTFENYTTTHMHPYILL